MIVIIKIGEKLLKKSYANSLFIMPNYLTIGSHLWFGISIFIQKLLLMFLVVSVNKIFLYHLSYIK